VMNSRRFIRSPRRRATKIQSERSCRLEIYNKVELARLVDRYFGRFCAFEDLVDVQSGAPGR
jgi:hypothetical protein